MLLIKVKTEDVRLSIPIPYALLNIAISIFVSSFFQKKLNKWTNEYFKRRKFDFTLPLIDKQTVKPLVQEMKNYKGLTLIDVQAKDGTEVKIRL
ncbi:hypothetical protein MKZ17_12215 [Solibacillus sp. FSL R7-0682]|uniref:hypothetical protein n=1 Tax=Solibacillus sp. FSL R7-0682 TaxID=2921690 RepID=UPI0030F686EA